MIFYLPAIVSNDQEWVLDQMSKLSALCCHGLECDKVHGPGWQVAWGCACSGARLLWRQATHSAPSSGLQSVSAVDFLGRCEQCSESPFIWHSHTRCHNHSHACSTRRHKRASRESWSSHHACSLFRITSKPALKLNKALLCQENNTLHCSGSSKLSQQGTSLGFLSLGAL